MPGLPDLRDRTFFPPLSRLPHDTGFTPSEREYYDLSVPTMTLQPRKHWCLLTEIVEPNYWPIRPMYKVKDITGQTFLAAFHFEDRGLFRKVEQEAVVGSTICVMYANLHYFADGQVGVRLEEPRDVKILPLGLEALTDISDRCRRAWNTGVGANTVVESCITCGSHASKRCSLCSIAPYCSKECQTQDWRENHKKECAMTRGVFKQMKSWNEFDWEQYNVHKGFTNFI